MFREQCKNYDILCLCESKTDDCDLELLQSEFESIGFKIFLKNRCKLKQRKSGGILVAYKQEIANYVTDIAKECEIVKWIRISKNLFGSDSDVILGTVYIPPRQSPYSKIDLFDELENDILDHNLDNEYVVLCGDFNSHTGVENDYVIMDDKIIEIGGMDENNNKNLDVEKSLKANTKRLNCDKLKKDTYGTRLLDLCKNTSMCIYNGRVGTDKSIGEVTTTKNTLIDYFIGQPKLLEHVKDLCVEDFDPMLSDIHKKVVLELKMNVVNDVDNVDDEGSHTASRKDIGKWKEEHTKQYVTNDDMLEELLSEVNSDNSPDIEHIMNMINKILIEAAYKTREYYKAKNSYRSCKAEQALNSLREKK